MHNFVNNHRSIHCLWPELVCKTWIGWQSCFVYFRTNSTSISSVWDSIFKL